MTNKIEFTEEANKQIIKITSEQEENSYFRISVQGGGCSGFKYNFSFDKKIELDDIVFNKTITESSNLSANLTHVQNGDHSNGSKNQNFISLFYKKTF